MRKLKGTDCRKILLKNIMKKTKGKEEDEEQVQKIGLRSKQKRKHIRKKRKDLKGENVITDWK